MLEIKVDQFKGPLDLLLDLIKKNKLDITQISLIKITDQYIKYLEELPEIAADEVADFLLVAAKLIFIKSKVLLPIIEEEEEEPSDLLEQLKIYKEYLDASKKINIMLNNNNFLFAGSGNKKEQTIFSPPKKINKNLLAIIFKNFLNNLNQKEIRQEKEKIIRKISLHEKIKEMSELLKNKKQIIWSDIFNSFLRKDERVVSFLALLELVRRENISIKQQKPFSEIIISKCKFL